MIYTQGIIPTQTSVIFVIATVIVSLSMCRSIETIKNKNKKL